MHKLTSKKWSVSGIIRLKATGVKTRVILPAMIAIIVSTLAVSTINAHGKNGGIVSSVDKAPIVPAGTTAGRVTDFVITLDTSLDPDVPGRTLLKGNQIKITLPDAFESSGLLPLAGVGSSPSCVPGNLQCDTGVLLQGWPQHPIRPPFKKYSLSMEGSSTIVFTALEDLVPNSPSEPGIKQIHLILNSFVNPHPGRYEIKVEAETGPGGAVETGSGTVRILPHPRASINQTGAFVPGTPNRIYQETSTEQLTPLPYDFLLWDKNGDPFVGVEIVPVDAGDDDDGKHGHKDDDDGKQGHKDDDDGKQGHKDDDDGKQGHKDDDDGEGPKLLAALMVHEGRTVGRVFIEGPKGAMGYSVFTAAPSVLINSPISTAPTGRMTVFFRAGSEPGDYTLTFSINNGNSVQTFVSAN